MAIRGITFSKQSVSPNDDSHIYRVLMNGKNGRTKGCKITFDTDSIHVSEGYFFAANRLIEIPSTETIATPIVTQDAYCRLVFEIDLSKTNTTTAFNQGYFKVLSDNAGYPEVTQENLEDGGNIYQLPFARFTKTILGIGNFVSELETIGSTTENTTIYVSTSGNDASGDGTESFPFATIQRAVDAVPKNLNDREITINVATGSYAEDVIVSGFYGGTLRFSFATVTINTFSVYEACVILSGTNLYLAATEKTYGFYCHRGANVISQIPISITGATNGVYAVFGSRFCGNRTVTVNSCMYAVVSMYASYVYISTLSGIQNINGIQASSGIASIVSIPSGFASTMYITSGGGRIYTGAQASVPAY